MFLLAVPKVAQRSNLPVLSAARSPERTCAERARLWVEDECARIDLGAAGAIIGVLFSRSSGDRLTVLPAHAPRDRGPGELAAWLLHECWGAYAAILADPLSGALYMLVDPSGMLPAYRFETASHVLLTSHPALLQEAAGRRIKVSWPALHAQLCRPELRQRSTCLDGVTELAPGALVALAGEERAAARMWQPSAFMPQDRAMSFTQVAEELRGLAVGVIGAWSRCLGPVAVAASGGVDSSFICAALARSGASFSCITLATADPSGDERSFVRLLADHLGVRCFAALHDPGLIDPHRPASAGLARPSRRPFLASLDSALLAAADHLGASAVLDGNGGDNLFCYLHSAAPIVDRLRCEGPGGGTLTTLLDMCQVTGCDIPAMARAVLMRLMRRGHPDRWPADTRLLAPAPERCRVPDPLTPWLDSEVGRHGGKRDHLSLIMRAQNHLHGLGAAGLPRFSPLMCQPLLEFCLAVPTWLWCAGGINRAPARAAFARDLPREIAVRTSKAGPDSFIRRSFERNCPAIRAMLLDGLLAHHGLLDIAATEQALSVDALSGGSIIYRLLDLAEAEAWARSWQG
ncbi:MAG: hypothetical protein KKC43_04785 [Alphaproteobacteria bacterium]|nr:hypothetical protein [Alphaproteobacteria bacterium]